MKSTTRSRRAVDSWGEQRKLASESRSSQPGFAKAETARAGAGCCVLAYQTQCPNCTGQGYDCGSGCTRWAWYCVDPAHHHWLCGECYAGRRVPRVLVWGDRLIVTNSRYLQTAGGGGEKR